MSKPMIRVDADLYEKIKVLAKKDGRSITNYVNIILKQHTNKGSL